MSSSIPLTVDFGNGTVNPGPPLNIGHTDFTYSNKVCPSQGEYTIVNKSFCSAKPEMDAGHIFFGSHPTPADTGYMMIVYLEPSPVPKIVFSDTVKNLCSGNQYVFWAAIDNLISSNCYKTDFDFNVETVSGQVIQSFETGSIGGRGDNHHPYFGLTGYDIKASFPYYYGGTFSLPPGINDVVVKIISNVSRSNCPAAFAIDNIQVTPAGPTVTIASPQSDGGWLISACDKGNHPLNLTSTFGAGYYDFSTQNFISQNFKQPAVQWQQSLDSGYTWTDIPGETNVNLSRNFSNPDTFFVRLRASEEYNINNPNCSVISNIIQANVDSKPKDFHVTSNSPVCEDSDIVLKVTGGATFITTGPNGFSDNSPFPHVYHPVLSDSGWYKTTVFTQGGCTAEDSTFVKVIGPNLITSIYPDNVCYADAVQLNASGAKTYVWTPPVFLNYANIANPISHPQTTTKYQVQATDAFGCSAFNTVVATVRDSILKANFISDSIYCSTDVVTFTDTSVGNVSKWFWSFGNGETSTQKNPSAPQYNYSRDITYPVQLIVSDEAACSDTITKYVRTVYNCYIAVPTAFTPNHDGLNDYLYPLNAYKATNLLFEVFNRFGKIVFKTTNWTKKWDGTVNGLPQPTGAYVWILNYDDENKKHISLKGTTVLIR